MAEERVLACSSSPSSLEGSRERNGGIGVEGENVVGVGAGDGGGGVGGGGANDENFFENRFNTMMVAMKKLQFDGLRDSFFPPSKSSLPSSPSSSSHASSPRHPPKPPPSPWRTPFSSFRANLGSRHASAEIDAAPSPGAPHATPLLSPDYPPSLAFSRPAWPGGEADGSAASTPSHSPLHRKSTRNEEKRHSRLRLKLPSVSAGGQSGSTNAQTNRDTGTFMLQDGSIVHNHDICRCSAHSTQLPSPPNFSYGPVPLLSKEDYLFDRLGLSEIEDVNTVYKAFMRAFKAYDVLPRSNKVIVLDTRLRVKKAFFALAYNSLRASTLWDAKAQTFVGMLTLTDFIRLLVMYHEEGLRSGLGDGHFEQLEELSIEEWRRALNLDSRPLLYVDAEASLHEALELLIQNKVHRLPLIESEGGNLMHIITHKRLLRFLFLYIYELPSPSFMFESIESLGIGTFRNIAKVSPDMLLLDALYLFLERRVSALPVISKDGTLADLYSRFDVLHLCRERIYQNLSTTTIQEAVAARPEVFEDVVTCRKSESLAVVAERLARYQIHRLVVIDEKRRVEGMISLSDVLDAMILNPKELDAEVD